MNEINEHQMWDFVANSSESTLMIVAPNFEARSLSLPQYLSQKGVVVDKILVGMITFESSNDRMDPLEYLKRENAKVAERLFRSARLRVVKHTIEYPEEYSNRSIFNALSAMTDHFDDPYNVVLDITAIPTRVLSDILGFFSEASRDEEDLRLSSLHIAYASPRSYPKPKTLSSSGRLHMYRSDKEVGEVTANAAFVNAAVILGADGFDAQHMLQLLPSNASVSTFAYLNQKNPLYSLEVFRSNVGMVYGTASSNIYLTIPSGHDQLINWAHGVELSEGTVNLIAPFGPRPLAISAWFAAEILRVRMDEVNSVLRRQTRIDSSDLVRYQTYHYRNSYTVGRGALTFFETYEVLRVSDET